MNAQTRPPAVHLNRAGPGARLLMRSVPWPVVSCEEAAVARGIPLGCELKTLLLRTSRGLIAAHLPGDKRLDLRRVKRFLNVRQACLADPEDLRRLGLEPGTVSAVLEPVWSMPHVVSRSVLAIDEVMTNNGTTTGYFAFSPEMLLTAAEVVVGDFDT